MALTSYYDTNDGNDDIQIIGGANDNIQEMVSGGDIEEISPPSTPEVRQEPKKPPPPRASR